MPESDESIVKRLTLALESLIPSAFGSGYRLSPVAPERIDRRYSYTFRYWFTDTEGKSRPLFVKIPHPAELGTLAEAIKSERLGTEIKHEYEILKTIATVISTSERPGLFAITPGGYSLDFNAIFMEEFPITMLKGYLTKSAIIFGSPDVWKRFEHLLHLSGVWLRTIHDEFHKARFASFDDVRIKDILLEELDALENMRGVPLSQIRKVLFSVYDLNKTYHMKMTSLHYDFHLGNIFVTDDGSVGALDPNWKEEGSIFEDLASILIDPMTRKHQVLSWGLLFRPSLKKKYEDAIIKGYFDNQEGPHHRGLYFYCAYLTLAKWRANEELLKDIFPAPLRFIRSIISKFFDTYFSRLVLQYLRSELETININYN